MLHFYASNHGGEVVHNQDAEVYEEQAAAEETVRKLSAFLHPE